MNQGKERTPIGVEAWFGLTALITVALVAYIPPLAQIQWIARLLCSYSILIGIFLGVLYLFQIGAGRSWPGAVGPFAFAGWAFHLILNT